MSRWPNHVGTATAILVCHLQDWVVFEPVTLITCVVPFVCGMASIEVNKESSILQCGRVGLNRTLKVYADQRPFCHGGARYAARDKKYLSITRQYTRCQRSNLWDALSCGILSWWRRDGGSHKYFDVCTAGAIGKDTLLLALLPLGAFCIQFSQGWEFDVVVD